MASKRHRHTWTALWWHFGQYRDGYDDLHVHSCFDEDCDRVLVGVGWSCPKTRDGHHWRETL